MELVITPPKKICVKNSPVHGLGIFATEKIIAGELIEECPILSLPMKFGETSSLFIDYRYQLALRFVSMGRTSYRFGICQFV